MKTIRFTETVIRRRHGTEQVFEEGVKYPLSDDIADHYLKRGQAQEVGGKAAKTAEKHSAKDPTSTENANADTVGGSADLGGKDGGDTGGRPKPAGKSAGRGKGGGRGKGKGAGGQ